MRHSTIGQTGSMFNLIYHHRKEEKNSPTTTTQPSLDLCYPTFPDNVRLRRRRWWRWVSLLLLLPATFPPKIPSTVFPSHTLDSYEPYEPAEPTFDEDEPGFEPQDPDDVENPDGTARTPHAGSGHNDPDALANGNVNGNAQTIVSVGEGEGTRSAGKKNAVVGLREKKIPESKRSTTPYMTKYERARVLGTRALQIR